MDAIIPLASHVRELGWCKEILADIGNFIGEGSSL